MKTWPQRLSGVPVKDKSWEDKERIKDIIAKAEARLGDQGRVFVRASGTEPLIRVMLEGKDDALLAELEKEIITIIEEELN